MDSTLRGLDGFPFSESDSLAAEHLLLNDYLSHEVTDFERFSPDPKWKKLPKRQTIDLIEAVLRRINWLVAHDADLRDAHLSRLKLIKLLRLLYTRKLPCTESDLRSMLDLTVPLLEHIAPDGPVDYVMEYVKDNELTQQLCKSLRNFQENLVEAGSVASMQSLRQRLHTLLWMDEWEPLDPARCWSECIRRDFRAMRDPHRKNWRQLLKHIRGNAPQNMPASWAREAESFLAGVGIDAFVEHLSLWFAPFRSGQPLPLSVAGSHILKGLIWYVAVSKDERAKEIALWLLEVNWRQKKNMTKSMMALQALGISKEELLSRGLIKETTRPPTNVLARVLEIFKAPNASTHIVLDNEGDLIVVQGQLHFYRLFRSSGNIERVTDNARLELNWAAIPDYERLHLRPECDSDDQLQRRAVMLMYDSLYGSYFKVSGK
ncbi:MAG TPA: hypothetical protein VLE19_06065 [Pyrinomonadaceae bacterium]|nr:hypothetical protein [Pyrinomonadaceae bacterium]